MHSQSILQQNVTPPLNLKRQKTFEIKRRTASGSQVAAVRELSLKGERLGLRNIVLR
jgi:hypothetical protein